MAVRILLVDDNNKSLKLLKAVYDAEGYETVTANDGREAMQVMMSERIDLVITDVLMPNVDGYYLCYMIRSTASLQHIPIIVYTATYISQSEEKIAIGMGADQFIRKPAALQVLVEAVKEILANPKRVQKKIDAAPESFEMMHQYSSKLVNKLKERNTELELAKEELETTLSRFIQAEKIAHLGHWSVDYKSQKASWSDEAFRIFGIEPGSMEPSQDLFLRHVHEGDVDRIRSLITQSMYEFTPFSFSHRIVRANGDVRTLLGSCQYEFSKTGEPMRLYGTVLDITEITENQKRLERANEELATFIYKAYHDLRSPIVSILGMVNVARIDIRDEKALTYFDTIGRISQKQNNMLMTLVKVMTLRDRELTSDSVDMALLLHDVLQSLKGLESFPKIDIRIVNKITSPVITDRELIFDILHNLIENSIQYCRAADPQVRIDLSIDPQKNMLMEVIDNGPGISETVLANVFDMFFRGALSKGPGLGLYVVKNSVEKLGGTIHAESVEDAGSTFYVKIPLNGIGH